MGIDAVSNVLGSTGLGRTTEARRRLGMKILTLRRTALVGVSGRSVGGFSSTIEVRPGTWLDESENPPCASVRIMCRRVYRGVVRFCKFFRERGIMVSYWNKLTEETSIASFVAEQRLSTLVTDVDGETSKVTDVAGEIPLTVEYSDDELEDVRGVDAVEVDILGDDEFDEWERARGNEEMATFWRPSFIPQTMQCSMTGTQIMSDTPLSLTQAWKLYTVNHCEVAGPAAE
ncbi:hypothetical protein B0H13DRAFT_1877170 [Mycena leptocephala]|nr:hypothetical protein B0H13DRAFT_1877170 [Mycena leptocephala]